MYSKSKKSKRRHILQLDYDDESSRSTRSPNSIQTNGSRVSPTPPSEPPKPALDDEFANFMAEIDAMPINEEMSQPPPPKEPEKPPEQPIEEVEETFDMIEPICQWQQCLDENTQCYYYWHMTTNDVKWEMPAEFSQHLLRHREYEEALAAFEARKQAQETQKALIQPPPPPPPEEEEEEEEEKEKTDEPVPSTQQGRNFLWFMRDHEREEKEKQEEKKRAYAKKFVKGKTLDEEKNDLAIEAPRTDNREEMLNKLSGHSKAMLQGKGKSKFLERIGAYRHSNGNSPVNNSADEAEKETVDEEEEEDEMALLLELQEKQAELLALEMEVCGSGSDSEPPPPESEPHVPPPPPPEEEPPLPPEPEPEPPSKKPRLEEKKAEKPKKPPEGKKPIEPKNERFVPKEGSLAVTEDQAEIEDLSSTLTSRLECMQITRDTMSKMQILLIEIQTRIVDWVAGALTTSHLLTKLREADKQVKEYETIATPPGWTCHFDREYNQYYYMCESTGESQWDYPITKADLPLDFGAKETESDSKAPSEPAPPKPKSLTPPPPPPAMTPPPPPPGCLLKSGDVPPPPPPPGLEPSSPDHVDMDIDEEGADVTVPELLPPPMPAALRPKVPHPPRQPYYPMAHYYPRPRPFPPALNPYYERSYYPAPAPPPEPKPRAAHVSAGPVLFKESQEKPASPVPVKTEPEPEPVEAKLPVQPVTDAAAPIVKKKKKKDKLKVNDSLSLKKKNVSGLVMKWQQAQEQVNQEVSKRHTEDDT